MWAKTLLLIALCLLQSLAFAEGLESSNLKLAGERPDASGPPTPITMGIYVLDIDAIDDVKQVFSIDMFVSVSWQDDRLALSETERKGDTRRVPLDEIWTPRGFIVNARGLNAQLPRIADIDDYGAVSFSQRLTGELAADLELREFPFDSQKLPIDFLTYQYSKDEMEFSLNNEISGDDGSFSIEGWTMQILDPVSSEFKPKGSSVIHPRITYYIEAKRNSRYYLVTMFLPMGLIVFMAWMVFWVPPDVIPSRIAISTASIFSLIAFGFSIRLSLPPVSYMTRADLFTMSCMFMVFLALTVAVIGSRWASTDRLPAAFKLSAWMRWVYVLLFMATSSIAFTM
ncbi:MAG: hypothetical protein OEU86_05425 [Gammaproteobacteria bacterium]|nr:hypothetical protein [Gammaproteobacteria bacterium]